MHRGFLKTGALLGMLSVAMGAMGSHLLKGKISVYAFDIYDTAIRYQFLHVFALLAVGILYRYFPGSIMKWAGRCFLIGIILFCGSLYILTAVKAAVQPGFKWLGPVTPVGGLFFICGWALMGIAFFQKPVDNPS